MKIRSQLALLVLAVVVPVALLAAATTARLWTLQREAYEQRYLERVSALRLALDTRLDATTRLLRGLSGSSDLDDPELMPRFVERFDRLLAVEPGVGDDRRARRRGQAGRGAHPRRHAADPAAGGDARRRLAAGLLRPARGRRRQLRHLRLGARAARRGEPRLALRRHLRARLARVPAQLSDLGTRHPDAQRPPGRHHRPNAQSRALGRPPLRARFPRAHPRPRRGRLADPRPRGTALLHRVQPLARRRLGARHRRAARGGRGVAARLDAGDARRRHRHRAAGRAVRDLDRLAHHRRDHRPLGRRPAAGGARRGTARTVGTAPGDRGGGDGASRAQPGPRAARRARRRARRRLCPRGLGARRGGAVERGQGRVPGDARPRAAQSPQRDEVGLGAARRAGRAAGDAAALARGDRAPGRAADRPRRRHARRRPPQLRQDRPRAPRHRPRGGRAPRARLVPGRRPEPAPARR